MIRRMFWAGAFLASALALSPLAQAQEESGPTAVDLAVTFTTERAKIAASDCGCFWLKGASVNGGVTLFRGLGMAANFTGQHSGSIAAGVDLNKFDFMAGPRYTLQTTRWTERFLRARRGTSVFSEALFGVAHGFQSVFPSSAGATSGANAFSMKVGGGLDVSLARGFGLRVVEINYVRSSLPNNAGDTQNDLRLGFGITYRLRWR
jgi:hypothetical protein